ncbi:efflux RND transporter periplasmic adaptor subunit [Singulisphaera sp. Ch08]|uniref:Efflux RND transporter periplasmic adaptor subunit n=1 Tax=Singulisphaera sp. Ch08 TaxID=3120278 RepID=A0AAU7C7V2_9BACT
MKITLLVLALTGAAGAAGAAYYAVHNAPAPRVAFRTAEVRRGDLLSSISATGTLEPEEVVDVGAQVMGSILEFGQDPRDPTKSIDYGSAVEKGTVLARIDPTLYEAALAQAEATLERSRADQDQSDAKWMLSEKEWKRAQSLVPKNAISPTDLDTAKANVLVAKAGVALCKAAIRQNEAALSTAKINVGYTTIKSPVRGVIVDRRVNVGQTVVASLNAPSLFLIAKDLRRMQVWASVNEADIGRIHPGMPATFTVDTYPGELFRGKVSQIRLNASMTQNIVTYTVVVTTDNTGGKLLPYLTTNVQFEVEKRPSVLLVPNAALRWKPEAAQLDAAVQDASPRSADSPGAPDRGVVWVRAGRGTVRPLAVVTGTSDGTVTEVSGDGVKEGLSVVIGEAGANNPKGDDNGDDAKQKNPFLPSPPKMPAGSGPF